MSCQPGRDLDDFRCHRCLRCAGSVRNCCRWISGFHHHPVHYRRVCCDLNCRCCCHGDYRCRCCGCYFRCHCFDLARYSAALHSERWVRSGHWAPARSVADFQFWGSQGLAFDRPARLKLTRLTHRSEASPPVSRYQARFLQGWISYGYLLMHRFSNGFALAAGINGASLRVRELYSYQLTPHNHFGLRAGIYVRH